MDVWSEWPHVRFANTRREAGLRITQPRRRGRVEGSLRRPLDIYLSWMSPTFLSPTFPEQLTPGISLRTRCFVATHLKNIATRGSAPGPGKGKREKGSRENFPGTTEPNTDASPSSTARRKKSAYSYTSRSPRPPSAKIVGVSRTALHHFINSRQLDPKASQPQSPTHRP